MIKANQNNKETKDHIESLVSNPDKINELKENVKRIAMPNATKDFVNFIYSYLEKEGN